MANYNELQQVLQSILDSQPVCPGDGNLDELADVCDFLGVLQYWGQPSVFDLDNDGMTDEWCGWSP